MHHHMGMKVGFVANMALLYYGIFLYVTGPMRMDSNTFHSLKDIKMDIIQ